MKKSFILLMVCCFLLAGYGVSFAGVVGTLHDMTVGGYGADTNICGYCHIPHNAIGDNIWSDQIQTTVPTGISTIGNLCYTCHDGTITDVGSLTAFNTALQQHKTAAASDCDACHDPHDNTNDNFVGIAATTSANTESATYCETCHNSTNSGSLGDHLAGSEHPYIDSGGTLLNDSCNACHQMHGAPNYTVGTLTNPILKVDNTNSAFCDDCHTLAGGLTDDYVQTTVDGIRHPANVTASSGAWPIVHCGSCHDVHQPTTSNPFLLNAANDDSAYCATCHDATAETSGPKIGGNTHPTGVGLGALTVGDATVAPLGNEIDDDDDAAVDYSGGTAVVVCETCHSTHQKGIVAKFLRADTDCSVTPSLCKNCHSNK